MKKITAKFITDNLDAMAHGAHINHRGAEYWMRCNQVLDNDNLYSDTKNGTIYHISADRKLSGSVNGHVYGKVIDGIAYHADDE